MARPGTPGAYSRQTVPATARTSVEPFAFGALQATQQAAAAPQMAQLGCAERFAAPAQHHVDPFGILDYREMWATNSTFNVRPRPLPVGPAYNSSQFDVFINTSFVMLVRSPGCGIFICR